MKDVDGDRDEPNPHPKERASRLCWYGTTQSRTVKDFEIVMVWDITIERDLRDLIGTTYTNKVHLLFGSLLERTPKLNVLDLEQSRDG